MLLAVRSATFYTQLAGIPLTLGTVILSHLLFTLPFVVLVVYARMRNFDYRVVESARDLGASPLHAFFTVTLPIIRPTVVGAALIAVSLSIDDFIITNFTIGGGVTLADLRLRHDPHLPDPGRQCRRHAHPGHDGRRHADRPSTHPLPGLGE